MSDKLTRLGFELQLLKEREAHDREKREMRDAFEASAQQLVLENKRLRERLALPPAKSEDDSEE